ncbi:MAG TPA: hypothetical protein VEC10_08140, partial [Steroidobacteraceae bacterium]|nr:hypothetical protein [Steroidobacteraceae bacterium]
MHAAAASARQLPVLALLALLTLPALVNAAATSAEAAGEGDTHSDTLTADSSSPDSKLDEIVPSTFRPPPAYGPPGPMPGVPAVAELEASGAVIGKIIIDNENIFDLDNPQDNNGLFRLADRLHIKTRAGVIRKQLLFR